MDIFDIMLHSCLSVHASLPVLIPIAFQHVGAVFNNEYIIIYIVYYFQNERMKNHILH